VQADGSILYSNTDASAASDTITYNVNDAAAQTSNNATITVSILGNQCTVTNPSPPSQCALKQVIILTFLSGSLSMCDSQTGANRDAQHVSLLDCLSFAGPGLPHPIILNGQAQNACGQINPLTVVNARGTDADWSVTGQVTDFTDGTRPA